MRAGTELTGVDDVYDSRSYLFTATDPQGYEEEILVVPCRDDDESAEVEAYVNRCTHEAQRLDMGRGVAMRDGQIICPKHGSMFDSCSGYCDNGEAADTTLPGVDVETEDGVVYLTDDAYSFAHEGGVEDGDDDDGPSSTSHIGF